jgi:hypothetical protein
MSETISETELKTDESHIDETRGGKLGSDEPQIGEPTAEEPQYEMSSESVDDMWAADDGDFDVPPPKPFFED